MRLNSKVTWGLAWTGLAVVLAVPSADYLTGQFGTTGKTAAVITSTTEPVTPAVPAAPSTEAPRQVATVTTKVTKTGVTIIPATTAKPSGSAAPVLDPVDKYVKSGKPLPDYISDDSSSEETATTAPPVTPAAPSVPAKTSEESPTQVAAIEPTPVAPVPFPARPAILDRPSTVAPKDPTVIVDESALATQADGSTMPRQLDVNAGPLPPAGIPDDWKSIRERRLTRFLERNGLVDDGVDSSASIVVIQRPPADYDPDGFYLSDGPNNARAERRARIEQMLSQDGSDDDFTWF
jgi:hypothetical protein